MEIKFHGIMDVAKAATLEGERSLNQNDESRYIQDSKKEGTVETPFLFLRNSRGRAHGYIISGHPASLALQFLERLDSSDFRSSFDAGNQRICGVFNPIEHR